MEKKKQKQSTVTEDPFNNHCFLATSSGTYWIKCKGFNSVQDSPDPSEVGAHAVTAKTQSWPTWACGLLLTLTWPWRVLLSVTALFSLGSTIHLNTVVQADLTQEWESPLERNTVHILGTVNMMMEAEYSWWIHLNRKPHLSERMSFTYYPTHRN